MFLLGSAELGPDKWSPDIFIRLINEGYGNRARRLIAEVHKS